jgi:hypothetical protein
MTFRWCWSRGSQKSIEVREQLNLLPNACHPCTNTKVTIDILKRYLLSSLFHLKMSHEYNTAIYPDPVSFPVIQLKGVFIFGPRGVSPPPPRERGLDDEYESFRARAAS